MRLNNLCKTLTLLIIILFSSYAISNTNINMYEVYRQSYFPKKACDAGYRLLTVDNARVLHSWLLNKMGPWDIIALADGWVIMGLKHKGQIKKDPVIPQDAWCTLNTPSLKPTIPVYEPIFYPESNEALFEWTLVNQEDFFKPLSLLAHYFGFAWVSGINSSYVGDGMVISRSASPGSYQISGFNQGRCTGYRCKERTSMVIDNFHYAIDDKTFKAGPISKSNKRIINTTSEIVINESSYTQKSSITLSYSQLSNWSKTDTYELGEKIKAKQGFEWPLVGETELSIEIAANQSWASLKGGSDSKTIVKTALITVPPFSQQEVFLETFLAEIEYPYSFDANVSFDITYSGFMRYENNALLSHSQDRPTIKKKYTIGRSSESLSNLEYQYSNPGYGDTGDYWDWRWMIDTYGKTNIEDVLASITQPLRTKITGVFSAKSTFGSTLRYGPTMPLQSNYVNKKTQEVNTSELNKYRIKKPTIIIKKIK
ncbi:aerolysin family beta-barrel pore-forming toxin [Iodobacter ciconiae]|uniref:Aerolysin family beta-barrel pore-forming toxin n=1 Tax=Iodobacter ciconiae TaxID=2496266 RepID=A0A3S8ZNV5_9NEIS|nr:aerolysin family beta-barrel pore-forming toxin [Iodobacter ciconiae]AZN35174.1 aerolysin family beta-barrel pore-forming toxin [Iodobacter ciconiae]